MKKVVAMATAALLCAVIALSGVGARAQQQGGVSSLASALGPTALDVGTQFGQAVGEQGSGAAATATGVASKVASTVMNVMDSMHTILLQFGTKVEVEVQYEPMDVPNGIHVREALSEQTDDKRIRIDATVYFNDDIEGKIPAASVRKWFGMSLPKKGDKLAGVPVRFSFPKSLMPYLDIRAKNFDTTNPTWTKRTDQNGVATIYLNLIYDQPMGGERETAEGSIEVDVPMGQTKGMSINLFDMVVRPLGDQIAKPVSAIRTLRIERHKPTKFQGTVTLQRTMISRWNGSAPGPQRMGDSVNTRANGSATWTERVELRDITLEDNGVGVGDYDYQLMGRIQGTTVSKFSTTCSGGEGSGSGIPRVLTSTYDYNGIVQDGSQGAAQVQITVDRRNRDQKYTVAILTHSITTSPMGLGRATGGTIKSRIESCDGVKSSSDPFDEGNGHVAGAATLPLSKVVALYDHIRGGWKAFDPDATTLAGSDTWDEPRVSAPDGGVSMTVSNTLTWSFRRLPAED